MEAGETSDVPLIGRVLVVISRSALARHKVTGVPGDRVTRVGIRDGRTVVIVLLGIIGLVARVPNGVEIAVEGAGRHHAKPADRLAESGGKEFNQSMSLFHLALP